MKRPFLAVSATALLFVAAPAFAQDISGYVGAAYAHDEASTPLGDDDGDGWFVEGAAHFGLGYNAQMQLDLSHSDTDELETTLGTVHLVSRMGGGAVGAFAGAARTEDGFGDADTWIVGLEGHRYYEFTTLTGSLAYGKVDDFDENFAGATVGVRYFPRENLRLDAGLTWARADIEGFDSGNLWSLGIGAEYQFDEFPVSLYASYSHGELEDADLDVDLFRVGVRFNFGTATLKARDRTGASFSPWGGLGDTVSRL
jgi:hypothetical protein